MKIKAFSLGSYQTNCYIAESISGTYIIDAPYPIERVLDFLNEKEIKPDAVLLTHAHHDHIFGLEAIRKAFPQIKIYIGEEDKAFLDDNGSALRRMLVSFDPGFKRQCSGISIPENIEVYKDQIGLFEVIKTPGHTEGSVSLYSKEDALLFSGDTLFQGGVGRTDIGGDFKTLLSSLSRLSALPENTTVLPGHGGFTTIGREKETNPYMK